MGGERVAMVVCMWNSVHVGGDHVWAGRWEGRHQWWLQVSVWDGRHPHWW